MKFKMQRLISILVITLLIWSSSEVKAQRFELTPFIGYETGANIWTDLGELHVEDGMNFGGALSANLGAGRYAEFSYNHLESSLEIQGGLYNEFLTDMAVDYYSFGVLQELKPDEKATPYGLFSLGWVNYRPLESNYSSENKMHVSLAGGVKIRASERIGIRLQARLLMPLYYAGTYFTFGTGGAGYSMGGGIKGVQGDFTGGLFFSF
jgi:hypothetical protein